MKALQGSWRCESYKYFHCCPSHLLCLILHQLYFAFGILEYLLQLRITISHLIIFHLLMCIMFTLAFTLPACRLRAQFDHYLQVNFDQCAANLFFNHKMLWIVFTVAALVWSCSLGIASAYLQKLCRSVLTLVGRQALRPSSNGLLFPTSSPYL